MTLLLSLPPSKVALNLASLQVPSLARGTHILLPLQDCTLFSKVAAASKKKIVSKLLAKPTHSILLLLRCLLFCSFLAFLVPTQHTYYPHSHTPTHMHAFIIAMCPRALSNWMNLREPSGTKKSAVCSTQPAENWQNFRSHLIFWVV